MITDQSGAVVPNLTVTVTNDETDIVTTFRTNNEGLYIFTGLRPAKHTLRAEAARPDSTCGEEGPGAAG